MAAAECRAEAPISAWGPFERGPRQCIGQDTAKIEAYLVLAVTARRYEFVKTGLGQVVRDDQGRPVMGYGGQNAVKSKLYEVRFLMSPFFVPFQGIYCLFSEDLTWTRLGATKKTSILVDGLMIRVEIMSHS